MAESFKESEPHEGVFAATADLASSAAATKPTADAEDRTQTTSSSATAAAESSKERSTESSNLSTPTNTRDHDLYADFENGYHFPPKYGTKDSWRHGLVGFWKYFTTPLGFLVVVYSLNVVAWGGMLFLLLCNASPAMCYPSCEDIESPRRKWIEWNSQTLNALFCVTGLGLAPWRFRDMYWLLKFRILGQHIGLRRLAGIHRGWFRLPGSQELPVDVAPGNIPDSVNRDIIPFPEEKVSDAPLTGMRAPPTPLWKLDYVLWMNIWNTFFQCCLCGFMWGLNRYDRPSWATGLFVGLAFLVGGLGGLGMFFEGKKVKAVEGVPLTDEDRQKLAADKAQGKLHFNNMKAKRPKEKQSDPEKGRKRGLKPKPKA
jgi:hypothetical protein